MASKKQGTGHRRAKMEDRSRIVVYLEEEEKEDVLEAASADGVSMSAFAARATLSEARRVNLDRELARRKK